MQPPLGGLPVCPEPTETVFNKRKALEGTMSSNYRLTLSQLTPRRLLLAAALAVTCLCAVAGQASAAIYPAHTVLNYCSNRAGLGKVYHGRYRGIGYLAWDSNYDGRLDHLALDVNRDGYVDLALADTNQDGIPDWIGLCNGRAQLWYSWSYIRAQMSQSEPTRESSPTSITVSGVPNNLATALNTPYNAASNAVWAELEPGMVNAAASADPWTVPVSSEP